MIITVTEIPSIIANIMALAKNIYIQAQEVKTNQTKCQRLAELVKSIAETINDIASRPTEKFLRPLSNLKKCLDDCQSFIEHNVKLNPLEKFIQATDIKKNFKSLMQTLQVLQSNFQLALVGLVMDQVQPLTDRQLKEEAERFYQQGMEYEKNGRLTEANTAYSDAIDRGHVKALTNLGLFCLKGIPGMPPDKQDACCYFLRAAEQNHTRAMHNLAKMYESGDGVEKNPALAALWYEKEKASQTDRSTYLKGEVTENSRHFRAI
jgi:TPR repeat protein